MGWGQQRACPGPRFEHQLEQPRPAGRWGLGGVATPSAGSCQLRGSRAPCVQCVYSPVSWKDRRGRGKEVRLSGRHSSTCLSFLSEHNPWEGPGSPPAWPRDPCLSLGTPRAVQTEELRKGVREGVREGSGEEWGERPSLAGGPSCRLSITALSPLACKAGPRRAGRQKAGLLLS